MPKPNLNTYNPFKRWPDGLYRDVNFLGGSVLALLSVALKHFYPADTSTAVGLRDRLVEHQGDNVAWTPNLHGVVEVFDKLQAGPTDIDTRPRMAKTTRKLNYPHHLGPVGLAGVTFNLCKNNPKLYPQAVIGRAAKHLPGREMRPNPRPSARLSLYALLGTTEERFSLPEIKQALKLDGEGVGSHLVKTPEQQGILAVERRGRGRSNPTLVQFTDEYRKPMMEFSSHIEALGTRDGLGLERGLQMAESAINDPDQVSHLMELGKAWTAHQAKVLTPLQLPPAE